MVDISGWTNISKSLLLPLYFRAVESKKKNPFVYDKKALEIIKKIDYDFEELSGFSIVHSATIMRESVFDCLVKDFIDKNPDGVIVNIGSGLDTRFFRMDNGEIIWYELDLPEVINTRKELFKETKRYRFISASAFDTGWTDLIERDKGRLLLIAEGFLLYFPRDIVRKFVRDLKDEFIGSSFYFDAVSPTQAVLSKFNPALKMMDVWFKWGMSYGEEIKFWDSDIETKDVIYYFEPSFDKLNWCSWYSMVPAVRFGFYIVSCILGRH